MDDDEHEHVQLTLTEEEQSHVRSAAHPPIPRTSTPTRGVAPEDRLLGRMIPENVDTLSASRAMSTCRRRDPLKLLYLRERENIETVRLLMRGMPIPCTYGFPGTDGTIFSNYTQFIKQFHPLISVWTAHPLHPFSRKERAVVFVCTVAFNMLWSTYLALQRNKVVGVAQDFYSTAALRFLTTKHACIVVYAVFIRQLVICPCPYNALLDELYDARSDRDIEALKEAADRLIRIKVTGDRVIVGLLMLHVAGIVGVIVWLASWTVNSDAGRREEHLNTPGSALVSISLSEVYNFFVWFVKFLPLFLLLYPIHRDAWFTNGKLQEYVLCQRHCAQYLRNQNYRDKRYPRCVEPVGEPAQSATLTHVLRDITQSYRSHLGFHLSSFRPTSELELRKLAPGKKSTDICLKTVR